MKNRIGQSFVNGEYKDINAVITPTPSGFHISGEKPFGGAPVTFTPLPEGFRGKFLIHKTASLADIVTREEDTVFRMGSLPTVYYEYREGFCFGYYVIEEVPK